MTWGKTWTVVFRCYNCSRKFTVRHITFDRVESLRIIHHPCPFCDARPIVQLPPNERLSKAHVLIDFTDAMETVYRKEQDGDIWHFHSSCSQWPLDDYIALDVAPRAERLCHECTAKAS